MSDQEPRSEDSVVHSSDRPSRQKPATREFGKRLQIAADRSDTIPQMNMGRFTFIQRELQKHHGFDVSRETVRKWFVGEAMPRPDKLKALAKLMRVDEAWLAVGASPSALPGESRVIAIRNEAAVNLLLGIMGMNGISCALPDEDESLADSVHFYAILGGRQWRIFVSIGQTNGNDVKFAGPGSYERVTTLGIIQRSISSFDIYQITPQLIAKFGRSRGGYSELKGTVVGRSVQFGSETVPAVTDFRSLAR